ncbi:MAG: tripartite tricarboxylate transporter substrate-binding protein [Alphaproteobacteria bacterium]
MIRRLLAATIVAAVLLPAAAAGQDRPLRIVFPFAAGGAGDAMTRLIGEQLQSGLKRPVIVENRTGAGGRIGVRAVADAPADGTTLLMTPSAMMTVYPHFRPGPGYDPARDFVPVAEVAVFDVAIAVGPHVPARTLADLQAWIAADPARASYGTPGAGTPAHFAGVEIARLSGLDLRHAPYRGTPAAMVDLLGGRIAFIISATAELIEGHRAGRTAILATSDAARSPFLPDVPTFHEAGLPFSFRAWYGLFAPARTPPAVATELGAAVVGVLAMPAMRARVLALGFRPTGADGATLAAALRDDLAAWGPIVAASGFTPDQ